MGSDGRACISSMATLLFGSSLACVQTTLMASSRSAFASADIAARGCAECDVCATELAEISKTSRRHFTQRHKVTDKGTKQDGNLLCAFVCNFVPLCEIFICAAIQPSASPKTPSHPHS